MQHHSSWKEAYTRNINEIHVNEVKFNKILWFTNRSFRNRIVANQAKSSSRKSIVECSYDIGLDMQIQNHKSNNSMPHKKHTHSCQTTNSMQHYKKFNKEQRLLFDDIVIQK